MERRHTVVEFGDFRRVSGPYSDLAGCLHLGVVAGVAPYIIEAECEDVVVFLDDTMAPARRDLPWSLHLVQQRLCPEQIVSLESLDKPFVQRLQKLICSDLLAIVS